MNKLEESDNQKEELTWKLVRNRWESSEHKNVSLNDTKFEKGARTFEFKNLRAKTL